MTGDRRPTPAAAAGPSADPRALRAAAGVTAAVLAAVLVSGATVLLLVQAVAFGLGAAGWSPYERAAAPVLRRRLGPARERADARPPQLAQAVGFLLALAGLVAAVTGAAAVFFAAVALGLVAALLDAAVGFCLGCEVYLLLRRATAARQSRPRSQEVPS